MSKKKGRNFIKLRAAGDVLDFGRLVAEEDQNLSRYYVARERYLNKAINIDDPAVFFVGPKGIGKSAILQMVSLMRSSDEHRVIRISPGDLAFSALANVEATSPILEDAGKKQWLFKALWDYVLALEVFRREYPEQGMLASFISRITGGRHEKEARKLLEISEGTGEHSLTSRILQLVKEVELSGEVAGTKVAAKASLDHTPPSFPGDSFRLLSLVNSAASRIGDNLRHNYYILIDDLDLYWTNTPTQNSFIAALFTTLRHFSRPPNLKCVVAIRNNIFESLPLIDRDKFHDWVCYLKWDYNSVREMIEQRVCFKLLLSRADVWGGLFDEGAFDTMWRRSNGRPREAIRLASLAVNVAVHEGHSSVTPADMEQAVLDFSKERITEVASEVEHTYPSIELVIRRMAGWPKEFPFSKLAELVDLIGVEVAAEEGNAPRYAWAAGFASNPIGFVKILLDSGILWIKASRTDEAKPQDPKNPLEITRDRWFAVHPMLAPALGLIGA